MLYLDVGIFDFFKKNKNIKNDNGINEIYFDDGKSEQLKLKYTNKESKYHGLYTEYFENGNKKKEIEYSDGKVHGKLLRYNTEGSLIRELCIENEKDTSIQKDYYSNGVIKLEIDSNKGEYKYFNKKGLQKFILLFDFKEATIYKRQISSSPPTYSNSVWGNSVTGFSTPTGKWTYFNDDGSINYQIDFCLDYGIYNYGFAYKLSYNQNKLISTKSIEILDFNALGIIIFSDLLYDEYDKELELLCDWKKPYKGTRSNQWSDSHLLRYTYTNFEINKEKLKQFIKSENPLTYAFTYEECLKKLMYQYMLKTNTLGKFKISEMNKKIWTYKNNQINIECKNKYSIFHHRTIDPSGTEDKQNYILTLKGDLFTARSSKQSKIKEKRLEQYNNLSMDPKAENYKEKVIGDTYTLEQDGIDYVIKLTENKAPDWFIKGNVPLYKKGDTIKYKNKELKLSALELSIFDLLTGAMMMIVSPASQLNPNYAIILDNYRNCIEWFRVENPELFDRLKEIFPNYFNIKEKKPIKLDVPDYSEIFNKYYEDLEEAIIKYVKGNLKGVPKEYTERYNHNNPNCNIEESVQTFFDLELETILPEMHKEKLAIENEEVGDNEDQAIDSGFYGDCDVEWDYNMNDIISNIMESNKLN